ncbi:hypothetical protein BGZ83_008537 [Gryganskiella cystojenkinii]|nr:hypothetical protein BGZ83_008537 [Gryganskiella cystojenkinii]
MPKRQRSGTGRSSARPQKQQRSEQQQEHNHHRALAIPEIILLIGEHLDKKPRVACLRLNRIFHQTLLSQLWKSSILSEEPIGPDYPELESHSSLVKELTITGTFTSNPMSRILSRLQCENLSVLTVTHRRFKQKPMAMMIERHKDTLQAVHYTIHDDFVLSEDLMKALPSCGQLKELSIKPLFFETPNQFLDQYVRLWSRLKVLTLGEVRFLGPEEGEDLDRLLKNTRPQTLRKLDFRRTPFDLACWTVLKSDRSLPRAHAAGPDSQLQVAVFQQHPQVPREPLAAGLTSLILQNCPLVTSLMVQDMLCTMPKLRTFAADFIFGYDIVEDDRAWVCNGLEKLALPFIMNPPPDLDEEEAERSRIGNQDAILTQFSRLERLEILDLNIKQHQLFNRKTNKWLTAKDALGLELTLDHGLDQLRSLRRILFIRDVFNSGTIWGPAEIEWCLAHWKRMLLSPGDTKEKRKMNDAIYWNWRHVEF